MLSDLGMDSDSDAARQVTGRGHRALPLWAGLGRPLPHLSYSGGALMPAPLRHAATRDWSTMSESAVSSTELFRLKVLTISSQVTTGFPPVFLPVAWGSAARVIAAKPSVTVATTSMVRAVVMVPPSCHCAATGFLPIRVSRP